MSIPLKFGQATASMPRPPTHRLQAHLNPTPPMVDERPFSGGHINGRIGRGTIRIGRGDPQETIRPKQSNNSAATNPGGASSPRSAAAPVNAHYSQHPP